MAKRYTSQEKGKMIASSQPRLRIRAPPLDTSDLVSENALTLIGRVTNPKVQRIWSLIPFLSQSWDLRGRALGSELGNDCFQFRFDLEEDLIKVLENRPYHFARYMVILQKWEPESLPSEIPFWIRIKGLPLHYCKEALVLKIGKALGRLEYHELTHSSARIKVAINGLKPLVKETIIEFENGAEAVIALEYEKLRNHCSYCNRLSHDDRNCPTKILPTKEDNRISPPPNTLALRASQNRGPHPSHFHRRTQESNLHSPSRRNADNRGHISNQDGNPRTSLSRNQIPTSRHNSHQNYNSHNQRDAVVRKSQSQGRDASYYSRETSRQNHRTSDYRGSAPRDKRHQRSETSQPAPNLVWKAKQSTAEQILPTESSQYRTRRPPLEREPSSQVSQPPPLPKSTEEVLEEFWRMNFGCLNEWMRRDEGRRITDPV